MKNLCLGCIATLLVMLTGNCFARIGETEQEAIKRYGAPVQFDAENIKPLFADLPELRFRFQDWRVRAVFIDGKTEVMTYMKIEMVASRDALLTKKDIDTILQAEAQGGHWEKVGKGATLTPVDRFQKMFSGASNVWSNEKGLIAWVRGDYAISIISQKALAHELAGQ